MTRRDFYPRTLPSAPGSLRRLLTAPTGALFVEAYNRTLDPAELQLAWSPYGRRTTTPERRLMCAVFERAMEDIMLPGCAEVVADAVHWFFDPPGLQSWWPYTCEHICEQLGINLACVRAELRRRLIARALDLPVEESAG